MLIDRLCYNSKLRYENAGEKFAFAILTLLICMISRSIIVAVLVLFVMGILTVYKGGIPLIPYLKCMLIPLGFLGLSTLAIVLHISDRPMDLFAIPLMQWHFSPGPHFIGQWYLTSSTHSMIYGLQLFVTALASVSCLYFLSFTTPMTDILGVLKVLHFPKLLIELMLLCYRFIFVLLETAHAISTSQKCRLGNRNYKTALKSFGMLGSALMIRAMTRSRKLYDAMETRCYDGNIRVLSQNHPPKKKRVVAIAVFEVALLVIAFGRELSLERVFL